MPYFRNAFLPQWYQRSNFVDRFDLIDIPSQINGPTKALYVKTLNLTAVYNPLFHFSFLKLHNYFFFFLLISFEVIFVFFLCSFLFILCHFTPHSYFCFLWGNKFILLFLLYICSVLNIIVVNNKFFLLFHLNHLNPSESFKVFQTCSALELMTASQTSTASSPTLCQVGF